LRGKLGAELGRPAGSAAAAHADVLQALLALGYSEREATAVVGKLAPELGVDDGIRQALKALAKA
jgi:holliday junction DNA helicase RuvA